MSVRYAVVAVNRSDGQARTIKVHNDMSAAQRQAAALNRNVAAKRYVSIPYEEIVRESPFECVCGLSFNLPGAFESHVLINSIQGNRHGRKE